RPGPRPPRSPSPWCRTPPRRRSAVRRPGNASLSRPNRSRAPRRPLLRSSRGGYVVAGRRSEGGSMQQFDQIETPSNGAPAWVKPAAGAAAGGTVILLAARRRRRKKREAEEKSVRRRAKRLADTVAREAGPTASKTATVVAAK